MNGLFGLNGLSGYILSVVVLLVIVFCLGFAAVATQRAQANNPYVIENVNDLQMKSAENHRHYKEVGAKQ